MSNLATTQSHASVIHYSPKQLDLVRRTVAKDLTPDEFDMFIAISRQNGLDPFKKQIHAVVYNKNRPDRRTVSFITGIDGYRAIAARSGDYRPDEQAPRIVIDEALKDADRNPLGIEYAEVTVYRYGRDQQWYPATGRAYWEEYAPIKEVWENGKPTGREGIDKKSNWVRMPKVMISKCAEAQALRRGWPEDLGNLYVDAEMDRATVIDLTATEVVEQEREAKRQQALGGPSLIVTFEFSEGAKAIPVGQFADQCLRFIRENEDANQIQGWLDYNRETFRQFWGIAPGDALELKKEIEKRIKTLQEKETA